MKDTIFLICTPNGVDRMVKTERSATDLRKNEIPIKLGVEVDSDNWRPPFIEKDIVIDRWDKDVDINDVHFDKQFVTEEEAELIRQERLRKMREILESQGYTILRSDEAEEVKE